MTLPPIYGLARNHKQGAEKRADLVNLLIVAACDQFIFSLDLGKEIVFIPSGKCIHKST